MSKNRIKFIESRKFKVGDCFHLVGMDGVEKISSLEKYTDPETRQNYQMVVCESGQQYAFRWRQKINVFIGDWEDYVKKDGWTPDTQGNASPMVEGIE